MGFGEVGMRLSLVLRTHICRHGKEWQDSSFASMAGCSELRLVREHRAIICYGAYIYNAFIRDQMTVTRFALLIDQLYISNK